MLRNVYLWILLLFELTVSGEAASVISLDSDLDDKYVISDGLTKEQLLPPVNVILHTYIHKETRACAKVVTIHLFHTDNTENFLDSFTVTCEVNTPFNVVNGLLDIGGTVFVKAVLGSDVWAVFLMANKCVQRRYTDSTWTALDEVEEMDLTPEQCKQVVAARKPLPVKPKPKPTTSVTLPEFGQTHGKIIMLGDSYIDHYQSADLPDKEESGPTAKIIVSRQTHKVTRECMDLIYIDMTSSEDFLDSAQVTCDDTATFVKGKDMLVYGGLIYLRDKMGEPVWALFLMKDDCQLRTYTDKDHKLITREDRKLDIGQCKRVVDTQQITWLPKVFKPPAAANGKLSSQKSSLQFNENLARVLQMIATYHGLTSLPNTPGPVYVPLGPQPLSPESPKPPLLTPQPLGYTPLKPQSANPQMPLSQSTGAQPPKAPPLPTSASKPTATAQTFTQQSLTSSQKVPFHFPDGQAVSRPMLSVASNDPKTGSPPGTSQPTPSTYQANDNSQGTLGGLLGGFFGKKSSPDVPNQTQQTATPTVASQSSPAPPEKKGWSFW